MAIEGAMGFRSPIQSIIVFQHCIALFTDEVIAVGAQPRVRLRLLRRSEEFGRAVRR